jgi:hypothetical protein
MESWRRSSRAKGSNGRKPAVTGSRAPASSTRRRGAAVRRGGAGEGQHRIIFLNRGSTRTSQLMGRMTAVQSTTTAAPPAVRDPATKQCAPTEPTGSKYRVSLQRPGVVAPHGPRRTIESDAAAHPPLNKCPRPSPAARSPGLSRPCRGRGLISRNLTATWSSHFGSRLGIEPRKRRGCPLSRAGPAAQRCAPTWSLSCIPGVQPPLPGSRWPHMGCGDSWSSRPMFRFIAIVPARPSACARPRRAAGVCVRAAGGTLRETQEWEGRREFAGRRARRHRG